MTRYWGFVAILALSGVGLVALGAIPTRWLAGTGSWKAMVAGVALGVLAGALSCLPAALAGSAPGNQVIVALGATGLRFAIIAAGGTFLALATSLPRVPLLSWIGISYLALLPLETRFILKSGPAPRGDEPLEIS